MNIRELISERLFFSLLTWIPFSMQNRVRNPLSNLNWTFDAKDTTGLRWNFRLQNWKMANKKNTSITVLLFWNCSCFEGSKFFVFLARSEIQSQKWLKYFHFSSRYWHLRRIELCQSNFSLVVANQNKYKYKGNSCLTKVISVCRYLKREQP